MVLRVCGKDLDVCMHVSVCVCHYLNKKTRKQNKKQKNKKTKKLNKYIPIIVFVYARMLLLFL